MGITTQTRRPNYTQSRQQTRRHSPDYILLLLAIALTAIGIIVIFSIGPAIQLEKGSTGGQYVLRQVIAVVLGLILFGITAAVPLEKWRSMYKPLIVLAILATLLALALPVNVEYPAHRWIRLGGFSFQSVELVKFAGVMWLGGFLAWRNQQGLITDFHKTMKPLLIALVATAVIVAGLQSDLGSFAVIVAMVGAMAFVAGLPMKRILIAGLIIAMLGVLLIAITPYRRARLTSFMHPSCSTSGYQACQALIAVGSGGMIGLGLGRSVQAYGYLPEADNDSIFAIYAEKFGFVGIVVLIGLFTAFFMRIKSIAERAPDDFSRLIVVGILVWLATQSIINVGAMVGLLPLKGITLPLISYGGSSVLMVMATLGVVFQVSRYTSLQPVLGENSVTGGAGYDYTSDRRRNRGAYHPTAGRRP